MHRENDTSFTPCTATLRDGQQVRIRTLAPTDGPALARLYVVLSNQDRMYFYPHPLTEEQALALTQGVDEAARPTIVAITSEGALAGYAYGTVREDGYWSLGICLHPRRRGSGLGSLLMEQLIEWAKKRNAAGLQLNVHKENTAAVRTYEKTGFVVEHEFINMWGGEQYHMRKPL